MSGTFTWTDPVTLQRREIAVPSTRAGALALVAHVPEPHRAKLVRGYDEGLLLYRTRLGALWYT